MEKKQGSMRLTLEGWRLLKALAAQSGITMTAIVEIAIREYASLKGITPPKQKD